MKSIWASNWKQDLEFCGGTAGQSRGAFGVANIGLVGVLHWVSTAPALTYSWLCWSRALGCAGLGGCSLGSWGQGSGARAQQLTVHRLSCFETCRIFVDQGSNLCLPSRQADSVPLSHQGRLNSCVRN